MPTKTIPQLPAANTLDGTELFDISQGGIESNALLSDVATFIGSSSGGPLHGSGSPVGVVTPSVIGQTYFDTTTPAFWAANGLTSGSWTQLV